MNPVFFFMGVDGAPSEGQNSDDGAIVIAGATPRHVVLPEDELAFPLDWRSWRFMPCYARRLTHKEKASARQYSGLIHRLHDDFRLSCICMDPNQGGVYIQRELVQVKQLVVDADGVLTNGAERNVRPIGDLVNAPGLVHDGDFILHMWKRGDPGVEMLWPKLSGDDLLNQVLYAEPKTALDLSECVELPMEIGEFLATRRDQFNSWPAEQQWCLKNLEALCAQARDVFVKMREDGETYLMTTRGAKQFDSHSKKDLVSAFMYCWMAFLIFLAKGEFEMEEAGERGGIESFLGWR